MAEIYHVPGRNLYSVVVLMQKTSSVDALDEKCVGGTVKKKCVGDGGVSGIVQLQGIGNHENHFMKWKNMICLYLVTPNF